MTAMSHETAMRSMKFISFMAVLSILFLLSEGCDYGRMYDQDSVKTYKRTLPAQDNRTIPVENGFTMLASGNPEKLKNPLPPSKETVEQGRASYGYYCVHCHGPNLDGRGSVGQSFSPLPTDLRSPSVLSQDDGAIYGKIRVGFKRHPRLFSTVSPEETWSIITFIRSPQKAQQ
jgi:mono/diheme cytochrome c family protein